MLKTLQGRADALVAAPEGDARTEAAYLLAAQTAAGDGWLGLENSLERLMVWVATVLPHGERHTLLEHPLEILESRAAWCDQNARVFAWLCGELFGLRARLLELKHTDGGSGHTVCEVWYGELWHLFDADSRHMACYRQGSILSFAALQDNSKVVAEYGHWWRGADGRGMDGFFVHPAKYVETWTSEKRRK